MLDLDYAEDSQADTDANFVLTGSGNIVEVQATAEKTPFSEEQFNALGAASSAVASYFAFADSIASWLMRYGLPAASARHYVSRLLPSLPDEVARLAWEVVAP